MTRTFGSLFAGAGGIDLGLESEGWSCRWQVEINKHAQMVERYHWPDVARYPDVTEINGAEIEPVDVIVGGFPCQDLSSAGQRAGMVEGTRSGLFYEFVRIVKEMRDGTMGASPRWVVWENVTGLLTLGNTLGSCYAAWDEIGAVVQEHRVVDSQFFGVPQRRRRVIGVVGFDPRAESWPEVLSDSESVRGYHQKSRATWETPASGVAGSLAAGCGTRTTNIEGVGSHVIVQPDGEQIPTTCVGIDDDDDGGLLADRGLVQSLTTGLASGGPDLAHAQAGWLVPSVTGALTASYGNQVAGAPEVDANLFLAQVIPEISGAVSVKWKKGTGGPAGDECYNLVPTVDIPDGGVLGVRRLTPLECERLMGWPDMHTALGVDETGDTVKMRDGARYTLCDNGVVAPVAAWVARKIDATDPPDA